MKNFLTGAVFIFTATFLFWMILVLIAYMWAHLNDNAKALIFLVGAPGLILTIIFGRDVGDNFYEWKDNR